MNKEAMTINRLPVRTWRWLRVNESHLKDVTVTGTKQANVSGLCVPKQQAWLDEAADFAADAAENEGSAGAFSAAHADENETKNAAKQETAACACSASAVPCERNAAFLQEADGDAAALFDWTDSVKTGMGADMEALVKEAGAKAQRFLLSEGEGAVKLHWHYTDGEQCVSAVELRAAAGTSMDVVMQMDADEAAQGFAGVQTKVLAQAGATVRIWQVQMAGAEFTLLNNLGIQCADNARVELYQVALGAGKNYIGCETALLGAQSQFQLDMGYLVDGAGRLDMNYNAVHTGVESESQMNANGVLRARASKLFRGTIDFHRGSKGAVGDEKEDVLLMDPTVINQTVPLILCAEEDVQGNHGATIGKLDEELIFYLESRGMKREAIYELMAGARIEAVTRQIPDGEVQKAVHARMGGQKGAGK